VHKKVSGVRISANYQPRKIMNDEFDPTLESIDKEPARKGVPTGILRKVGFAAIIFCILQGPLFMVQNVIESRQSFNAEFPLTYKGFGAGQQTIVGPVLTVPYHLHESAQPAVSSKPPAGSTPIASTDNKSGAPSNVVTGPNPAETETPGLPPISDPSPPVSAKSEPPPPTQTPGIGYLHFFPEKLVVDGHLDPELRDEGKFKSILYSSDLSFKGSFNTAEFKQKNLNPNDLIWKDAYVAVGISDLRGVKTQTILDWNGAKYKFTPGTNGLSLFSTGQHVQLNNVTGSGSYPFSFKLNLNGSRDMNIFPAGSENKISLSSPWTEPTFIGGFLPHERVIDSHGFNSIWEVSYFTRNLPQVWTDKDPQMQNSLAQYMVGVTLATPVEFYRTAIRAVKYGSLFISMTFLCFFIFELSARIKIHEIQYLFVGLALILFFLLLVAFSEVVPFVWAYVIATVPTVIQITWYTQAFSKSASKHLWKFTGATLTMLYGYLYVLLQLEDLALLFGAVGLFVALSVVLFLTRNINWYNEEARLS